MTDRERSVTDLERVVKDRGEGLENTTLSLETREAHHQAQRPKIVGLNDGMREKIVKVDAIIRMLPDKIDKITKDVQAGVQHAAREWGEKDEVHRFQRAVGAVGPDSGVVDMIEQIRGEKQEPRRPQRRPQRRDYDL